MTQHTPGQGQAPLSELVQHITEGAYGGKIARLDIEYDDGSHSLVPAHVAQEAARLIKAAPDLLAALEEAKRTIKAHHGPEAWDLYDAHSPEMKKINAAIAKAKGEDA